MIMELVELFLTNSNIHEWNASDFKLLQGLSLSELDVIFNTLSSLERTPMLRSENWK